jgi:hypothetical protein
VQYNVVTPGTLRLSAAGGQALAGQGSIVLISFKLLRQGNVGLNFINTGYTLLNEGSPTLVLTNGLVNILPKPYITVTPNQGTIAIGETLQFYSYYGTAPYTYSVTDASVASISSTGLLTGLKRGLINVISTDQHGVIDSTDQKIEVVPFKLTIRDTTYYQNQWVDIPINISSLNVEQVKSGEVTISYSGTVLTAQSIITTGTLLSTASVQLNNQDPNKIIVTFAQSGTLTGKGVLFIIRFKIANQPNGATNLTFNSAVFNEVLYAVYDPGYFTIKPLPPLNVTPKTALAYTGEQVPFAVSGGTPPYQWIVSDNNVATISSGGLLTAIAGGDVIVSATDFYGSTGSSNTISIYDGKLTVAEVSAPANTGLVVNIPVTISSVPPGKGIISFSGEIAFTATKIASFGLNRAASITENWAVAQNTNSNLYKFALAGTQPTLNNNLLMTVQAVLGSQVVNGNVIPIEINQAIANEGSPRLLVDQGKITVTMATGLNNPNTDKFVLYPNPCTDWVLFKGQPNISTVNIISLTGKIVSTVKYESTVKEGKLDVSRLNRGIYIIQYGGGEGEFYSKLTVE